MKSAFRMIRWIAIMVPFFLTLAAGAEPLADQHDLLAKINAAFQQRRVWVSDFTQEARLPDVGEPVVSRGKVYFQLPDQMRWEFMTPERQLLISDGQTLWFYDEALRQVMVGQVARMMEARLMVNLLTNLERLQQDYRVVVGGAPEENDPRILVALEPQTSDAEGKPFTRLQLYFDRLTLQLVESRMIDLFANEIIITYAWNLAAEQDLPATFFHFSPPPGTDVIPLSQ
ncbi:MAG: outer membrane lipoprotein carrier protein LolA [Deltaproteobacteria bacterium]|nr:outer membrane lipoprotein carrier protein LolA [Candidatus Anaeroferrophillus wilburensis]MBN2888060.1 outer membrane lipoprotein carrier protein LolA [Deltaproteobacteria bacterium]